MYIYTHSFTEQIYAIVDVYDDDEFNIGLKRTYIFYSEAEYKHQKNIHYKNQATLQEVWQERFKHI